MKLCIHNVSLQITIIIIILLKTQGQKLLTKQGSDEAIHITEATEMYSPLDSVILLLERIPRK